MSKAENRSGGRLAPVVRHAVRWLAEVLAAVYLAAFIMAQWVVNGMLFPVPPVTQEPGEVSRFLVTESGLRVAWREYSAPSPAATIVYSHGNYEDLGALDAFLEEAAARLGIHLVAYDYPGYGHSRGRASVRNSNEALAAVLRHLNERGLSDADIILWGRSVGGGPTLALARHRAFRGIILQSAFISAFRVVTHLPLFPFDRYNNASILRRITTPVLILHGEEDRTIPIQHGRALYAAARGPKTACWIPGAGHDDLDAVAPEVYWNALRTFIHSIGMEEGS